MDEAAAIEVKACPTPIVDVLNTVTNTVCITCVAGVTFAIPEEPCTDAGMIAVCTVVATDATVCTEDCTRVARDVEVPVVVYGASRVEVIVRFELCVYVMSVDTVCSDVWDGIIRTTETTVEVVIEVSVGICRLDIRVRLFVRLLVVKVDTVAVVVTAIGVVATSCTTDGTEVIKLVSIVLTTVEGTSVVTLLMAVPNMICVMLTSCGIAETNDDTRDCVVIDPSVDIVELVAVGAANTGASAVATTVEVMTVCGDGTAALDTGGIVKFAQVILVAFENCMTRLQFPMNAVLFGCVERKRSI